MKTKFAEMLNKKADAMEDMADRLQKIADRDGTDLPKFVKEERLAASIYRDIAAIYEATNGVC